MKHPNKSILIIAVPRSGSTSLCNSFSKSFFEISEPLNETLLWRSPLDTKSFIEQISKKNIVVKTMPNHLPSDWKQKDYLNFIDNIIPYFDHVILLDRKNVKKQYDSYVKIMNYLQNDGRWPEWTEEKLSLAERFFWLQKYLIREISINHNLKISFYEDIFFDNYNSLFNDLGIDIELIDTRCLDSKNKYKENLFKVELPKSLI